MFRQFILAIAFLNVPALISSAQNPAPAVAPVSTTLTVILTGLRNSNGQVFIQLWKSPHGFPRQGEEVYKYVAIDATKAVNGAVTTTFSELTPGTYAVSTLHDENRNGKMDSNAFGIPKEGWAVSNNVVTHTHAPSFDQASFQVPAEGQKISIALHY